MESTRKPLHPMLWVAAASVTIASLAAAAHFTGLLPARGSEVPAPVAASAPPAAAIAETPAPPLAEPPAAQTPTAPPAPAAVAKPARKPAADMHAGEPARATRHAVHNETRQEAGRRLAANDAGIDVIQASPAPAAGYPGPAAAAEPAPPVCHDCGTVESVREVAVKGQGSGLGAVAGGVLGGVLGHQVGRGTGKDLATIAGAVGGAFAGHQVEKNVRTEKQYQVTVRFDDGAVRSYTVSDPSWTSGERVRLNNGSLAPL